MVELYAFWESKAFLNFFLPYRMDLLYFMRKAMEK